MAGDAEQILRAAYRGRELTSLLLAYAGREASRPEIVDLPALLGEVAQAVRTSLDGAPVTLVADIAADLPPVHADPAQLTRVVQHLATNARDAMPDGGTLLLDGALVILDDGYRALRPGPHVRIRVGDTGVGMPAEVVARAVEPYFSTRPSGTGLGLAAAHGMVIRAGGELLLWSEPGLGTTAQILLPAVTLDEQSRAAAGPAAPGRGETIVVLAHDSTLRAETCRILDNHGYRVLAAADPSTALAVAGAHGGPVDLLLTDAVLPGAVGKDIVDLVPATRLLYMSGHARSILVSHAVVDADAPLLEKPFGRSELLRAVRISLDAQG
jgi:CheY-like chemotaxis protein